jgi:tetratricopeptide (TPR) repeat protein
MADGKSPSDLQFHDALAVAGRYLEHKKWQEAEAICRRLLEAFPDSAEAHNSLGLALSGMRRYAPAKKQLRRAIELAPQKASYYNNLCIAHYRTGELDIAIDLARRAVKLTPDVAATHVNLSFALLARGDFIDGWSEYEWRLRAAEVRATVLRRPWRGENLAGKHVCVRAEQGLGDMMQFSRYLGRLTKQAGKVSFGVEPSLVSLFRTSFPEIDVFAGDEGVPIAYDFDIHAMSLPYAFETRLESIPADVPYLRAPEKAIARWREKLAPLPGLKVGLVWAGNPQNSTDRIRSLEPAHLPALLAPLLRAPGVSFVSLQLGARAADLLYLKPKDAKKILDLSCDLADFADTAGAMMNLDLVISIDSAPAHLAGALGKPVWLLLASHTDWRWLIDRDDTPWYPSMRLFRQRTGEGWPPVIERVVATLKRAVTDPSLLAPFRAEGERRAAAARAILEDETAQAKSDPAPPPTAIGEKLRHAEQA